MYCRECGKPIAAGDKFCSSCGAKVEAAGFAADVAAPAQPEASSFKIDDNDPLFEPFDFKEFGFDFSDLGLGLSLEEEKTSAPATEEFNWNTNAFPGSEPTKTEDVDFNWSLNQEAEKEAAPVEKPAAPVEAPETIKAPETKWESAKPEDQTAKLEEELFGGLDDKADQTRKQSEEIDKFFTFHKKNEEFQKILDREYEKVKSGNILTEEMSAADAVSAEKYTAQEDDPMEAMFKDAGVVQPYEPKPVETDVLERIEAAEEEKRVREEAARLVAEEKARQAAEEERLAREAAEKQLAEERARAEAEAAAAAAAAAEPAVETIPVVEVPAEEPAVETIPVVEVPAEDPAVETIPVMDVPAEEPAPAPEAPAEPVAEPVEEPVEKTKQVDKAAILAGMAMANEMVERDRAMAAAEAAAAEAPAEEAKVELPDFLGHEELIAEEPAEEQEDDGVEFSIFEELEGTTETPAEEIILPESQTIEELFADAEPAQAVTEHTLILTEDSVAEILNGAAAAPEIGEEKPMEDTMIFSAETLGVILAEAEQNDPDAEEVVVSVEDLIAAEAVARNTITEGGAIAAAVAAEEEEEEETGGKGRTFLKVCLVILCILLALEIAGVAIKIAAPTSNAANFIDAQLNKVFQLISGEEDKEISVFAEVEEIRNEPLDDKTTLIQAEMGKNKDGNIEVVEYNADLGLEAGKKYENTDLNLTQELTTVTWYKNADNKQVYYDQAMVGTLIAYNSQRVNKVNNDDDTVLNLMVEDTDLYDEIKDADGSDIEFNTLQIGEIRESGSSYYVWVAEEIDSSTDEFVYELKAEGESMKVYARHDA